MSILSKPHFHDEAAAFEFVEGIIWNGTPVCPHCGCSGRITVIKANPEKKIRMGLKRCGDCKKQFTVRIGTIFEESHLPMTKWLQAIHLLTASKKGVSSHQLHRMLEITYKSAWFLSHRIREAMRTGELAPFGGNGGAVEVDETYIGRVPGRKVKTGSGHKMKVLALVDRASGQSRAMVLDKITVNEVQPILRANIAKEARLMTDESTLYKKIGAEFAEHGVVTHWTGEYVRRDEPTIHTNTIEGYFSIFKRGMRGVYQHASPKHLHRYVAEFNFRYSNRSALGVEDQERAAIALKGFTGKRLTYKKSHVGA